MRGLRSKRNLGDVKRLNGTVNIVLSKEKTNEEGTYKYISKLTYNGNYMQFDSIMAIKKRESVSATDKKRNSMSGEW